MIVACLCPHGARGQKAVLRQRLVPHFARAAAADRSAIARLRRPPIPRPATGRAFWWSAFKGARTLCDDDYTAGLPRSKYGAWDYVVTFFSLGLGLLQ